MTAPTPTFSYPLRTKIIVVVVLAVAIGGFVFAGLVADTDSSDVVAVNGAGVDTGGAPSDLGRGVEAVRPIDGAQSVFQQSELVLDLEPGWVAELVYAPDDGESLVLPADEVDYTPELDQYTYVPSEGKAIDRLAANRSCVIATIWSQVEGRAASERVVQWCFRVV